MTIALMMVGMVTVSAAERTWTRSEILAIADKEAQELGYNVEQMGVSFDIHNSVWRDHLKISSHEGSMLEIEAKLKGRRCWAVYYLPLKEFELGGDVFVFVDRDTGEIIGTLQGK